jgi:hypothetical protein
MPTQAPADFAERLLLNETCDCRWLTAASCCEERCAFGGVVSRLPDEGTCGLWEE